MAFGKRNQEEIKMEDTKIWECTSEKCNCWVRDNFKVEESPKCPICGSAMDSTTKELQVVENHNVKWNKE